MRSDFTSSPYGCTVDPALTPAPAASPPSVWRTGSGVQRPVGQQARAPRAATSLPLSPRGPASAADLAALQRSISSGEVLFPRTLRRLRARWGITQRAPLPASVDKSTARCLLDAFDQERSLHTAYLFALVSDGVSDTCTPISSMLDVFLDPDAAFEQYVQNTSMLNGPVDPSFLRALRFGTLPFAAWSVTALLMHHIPFPSPEGRAIHRAVGVTASLPWVGLPSIDRLVSTVRLNMHWLLELHAPFDFSVAAHALAHIISTLPLPPQDHFLWGPMQLRVDVVHRRFASALISAESALRLMLNELHSLLHYSALTAPVQWTRLAGRSRLTR